MVYIQAVHGLVKRPQSYKIYFLEDKLPVSIYVQFIWLANVVFLKKANNRTCPSNNIRKYGRNVENVNTNFWLSSANVFLRNNTPQSYKIYFIEDKLSVYNIRTVYLTS